MSSAVFNFTDGTKKVVEQLDVTPRHIAQGIEKREAFILPTTMGTVIISPDNLTHVNYIDR